ncbi:uncharacterized protein [Ptychodera flava]|uniref:uncharacterized protein n=1 Tax=Ptychodera flava TaxID=63121 RepID=UPI00396A79FB
MNLYKNVFNTPGELHLIQVSDDFDDVIVNTAKKLELKGIVFNLKSHQTLQHSIANTILPYYASQKAINSPALQGKYLLSWEQDQISAIFNQMVHQSLMLSQYLSTEGFHILLDAFQHTISEYNSRHHNTETRLHLLIQKPEMLMEHHSDNDAETVKQFMRMISSLVEDCQVTVLMMTHKRDFVQWMQTSGDFDSVDASHWFIGEPLYNDTISWFTSVYGSFVTLPQMKTAIQTVGTSRKQINKLLQKVTKGQKFQDAVKTYKEEVMFKFIHELKKMNQPGIVLSLFEEFAKPESKRQLYCPQRSPVPVATEYSMEYLEQLEDRGFIYFQSGTSLYGGCGGRVYKPVMKHLIGYQEFISKKMTVLSVQVNNGDRVYPIELQELSVCHMLEKLENHGIDTTRFEYFTVNSRHWYHGNIYRHSDAVLKYLSRNTEVDMKFEETKETEPESQYAKFKGKAGSLEDDGWIGWFTSFVW